MASNRFRARPGYERLPGRARRYRDTATGEEISKRQYVKRTENVKSLEEKAKRKAREREAAGQRKPLSRYNAIVKQYKLTHGAKAKVKGNSPEAIAFRKAYDEFTRPTHTHQQRIRHLRYAVKLGFITHAEFERYAEEEY